MERIDMNRGWQVSCSQGFFGSNNKEMRKTVDLPYDAMIVQDRHPESQNGPDAAWYDGGTYCYEKCLEIPASWEQHPVYIEFEGAAQNAMLYVDDQYVGKCPYAYSGFTFDIAPYLNYSGTSTIKLVTKTGMQKTSRWYSGAGILRPVWLWIGNRTQIALDSLRFTTERCSEKEAAVSCRVTIEHKELGRAARRVLFTVMAPDGTVVAEDDQPITLFAIDSMDVTSRMLIEKPLLWSAEHPDLYTVSVKVKNGDVILDESSIRTGIRNIDVDAVHGFQINGRSVKLRGGAIHHDNGILGAISLKDAEVRRVKRLKAAGFNAIRSAHNPASKAMVEACDEIGMYLMDELFDVWNQSKRDHDYSLYFAEWWERDMQAMVRKDYNHPSVVIYTVGNEIPDTGTAEGARQNRQLIEKLRELDPSRPITNCINGMFSVIPHMREILAEILNEQIDTLPEDINELMSMFDAHIDEIMQSDRIASATEETFAGLQLCGYNYMESRYILDHQKYPNRVIVGSETTPGKIGRNWPLVLSQNHVIGDFCWTGWDYLGEAGVGKNDYDMTHAMYGPWPWYTAYCGDYDICGNRRPQSYYREIVFGLRSDPYIAVERPQHFNQPKTVSNWTWPDVIESWSWPGFEGRKTHVEIYSNAEIVELYINDKLIGEKTVGREMPYKAAFEAIYEPGIITAVSYRGGIETGRMSLSTAQEPFAVEVELEANGIQADGKSLIYADLRIVDENGELCPDCQKTVTLHLDGDAVLRGFGSANPATSERFDSLTHSVFDGKALAVFSSCKKGEAMLTASAVGLHAGKAKLSFV